MKYSLTWIIGSGEGSIGGHQRDIKLDDIFKKLSELISKGEGSLGLEKLNGDEIGAYSLDIRLENQNIFMSLVELTEDGENEVREYDGTIFNEDMTVKEDVVIMGDIYTPSAITQDVNLVKRVFQEFFETGDVSREILD